MIPAMLATDPHRGRAAMVANGDLPVAAVPVRVLIVEDQRFVADAMHHLLSEQPGMLVVGRVGSLADSLPLVVTLQPDVVMIEFHPSEESTATVKKIQDGSEAKLIFLAHVETENLILAAVECGASAVLTLSTAADDVIHAVRTVAAGGSLITSPAIASALRQRRRTDGLRDKLTSRERQVVTLLSEGSSNREIARRMGISYTTVRSHVRNVSSKLAAHSKLEVLVRAQRLELVD